MARQELTDEQLFNRLIRGDRESLRPLMERHGDAVKFYIHGYISDIDMAEEIMLEAFARLLVKAPTLRTGGFKPYLYKTARNLALKHLNYRSRFTSLDALAFEPVEDRQLEEGLLRDERERELYRNLDRIAPEYREALYLVYIEELSYVEAAAVMRKSRKQVENLVYRGKRAMKALMDKGEEAGKGASSAAASPMRLSPAAIGGDGA
ncbi:MAG: RNA polymerase sigma factor [Coriobacteriia bacterium]|nr:RNA polymerase sigma factor [Coriobacteriia bacterium]